jgi:hypothetical protein
MIVTRMFTAQMQKKGGSPFDKPPPVNALAPQLAMRYASHKALAIT